MDSTLAVENLRNCRKGAARELKEFKDSMDLPAFIAVAEVYINKSTTVSEEEGCLRIWMLAKTAIFDKYYSHIILKDSWKSCADLLCDSLINRLDAILISAGYVRKGVNNNPELRWDNIVPEKSDPIIIDIGNRYPGKVFVEKTIFNNLKIIFNNSRDWEEAKKLYPEATPHVGKTEMRWVLDE